MAAGVLLLLTAGVLSPVIDSLAGGAGVKAGPVSVPEEEDEILNNKTKWRIILAGYIVFALIAVFSIISIFTLNHKINTLYNSVQELERMQIPIEERELPPGMK